MFGVRIEFKLADMWVGVFWKRTTETSVEVAGGEAQIMTRPRIDVWICLLPCVPLHLLIVSRWSAECVPYVDFKPLDLGAWE
jgi:hypothetical protein